MSKRTDEGGSRVNYLPSPFALFKLRTFGGILNDLTGVHAYLVGSVLEKPDYRDVDVRLMLDVDAFERIFGEDPEWITNPPLRLANMALTALGREMTGLELDVQIQREDGANASYGDRQRHPLFPLGSIPKSG